MISNNKLLQINFYLLLIFPLTLVFSKFLSETIMFLTIISLLTNFDFLKKKLKEKWAIFFLLFYLWLCIVTLQQMNIENSLKSLSYIRFLLFTLGIILVLDTKKKFYLFLTAIFITISFIQFDLLIQFFFGTDIFGYKPSNEVRFSGPFGKELIAGGFLTKFFGISFLSNSVVIQNEALVFLATSLYFFE